MEGSCSWRRYLAVVICAEDTDAFVLTLAFHDKIRVPLYQKCGNKARSRIVDITEVAAKIVTSACQALLGMHAFTGCDTVRAFAGRGKAKALKLLTNSKEHQDMFLLLGQEWDVSPDLSDKLEHSHALFMLTKHQPPKLMLLDTTCSKVKIESLQLAPCKDCFEACTKS